MRQQQIGHAVRNVWLVEQKLRAEVRMGRYGGNGGDMGVDAGAVTTIQSGGWKIQTSEWVSNSELAFFRCKKHEWKMYRLIK
jgi:hypothetical protein